MKKLFHLLTCAVAGLAAVAFTGCNKDKNEPASEIIIAGDASIAVTKAGGPQTITFSANYDWTAKATLTPTGDWCTITPTSGKAGTACTISVTIGANSTETAREAVVAIATVKEPSLSKSVKFTQAANTDPKDVTVTVMSGADAYPMTLLDRNIGATALGGTGTFMTWTDAIKACPTGYHLMSSQDYTDLSDKKGTFNSSAKLKDAAFKLPIATGYYDGTTLKKETLGWYWLLDEWIPGWDDEGTGYSVDTNFDAQGWSTQPFARDINLKMQARCVKDEAQ